MIAALLLAAQVTVPYTGTWRAQLDLAGGPLRVTITIRESGGDTQAELCNGSSCQQFSSLTWHQGPEDSLILGLADYDAWIRVRLTRDSLVGFYRNVGSRGPRTIPLRAARGQWPASRVSARVAGRWDAWYQAPGGRASPRVFEFRATPRGLEGTILTNSGDQGAFWGGAAGDSLWMGHFDGSFVYLLTGRLDGDTLRGVFHAGVRSQTPFVAVRATGRPHLVPPTAVVRADSAPFRFAFPDVDDGRELRSDDPRFRGKVVLVDIVGTWCPTCHDAAPTIVDLHRRYAGRGLEVVALAYEVSGDTAVDGALVRRYRDKFDIRFPILLAGTYDGSGPVSESPLALTGPIAFPTVVFIDRRGIIRRIHAGFYGPATGAAHAVLVREFDDLVRALIEERP